MRISDLVFAARETSRGRRRNFRAEITTLEDRIVLSTLINFEDLPNGTPVTTQYSSSSVLFSGATILTVRDPSYPPHSGVNVITASQLDGTYGSYMEIQATPGAAWSEIGSYVTSHSIAIGIFPPSDVYVDAYDANNNLVTSLKLSGTNILFDIKHDNITKLSLECYSDDQFTLDDLFLETGVRYVTPEVSVIGPDTDPQMGQTYYFNMFATNPNTYPVSVHIDFQELVGSAVPFNEPLQSLNQTITLGSGESKVVMFGPFNHTWNWLPNTSPTVDMEEEAKLEDALLDATPELINGISDSLAYKLTPTGEIPLVKSQAVLSTISTFVSTFTTSVDLEKLFLDVNFTNEVNDFVKVTDDRGNVVFSQTTQVVVSATQEQQDHLLWHEVYFIFEREFQTGIPLVDVILPGIFAGLAANEYRLAKRTM